jgi:predicted glycoside hydrolase/deacetylase ChbG (UPF0249 family)
MGCKITADDYGMSAEINLAISDLVKQNIVSRVSVMANESLIYSADDIVKGAEVGLHLNFISYTQGVGINWESGMSLLKLVSLIYRKKIRTDQITASIEYQFALLEKRGFNARYMDTHMHTHILPILLDLIIDAAKSKNINSIRCISMERRHLFFYFRSLLKFGFWAQAPKMILLYSIGMFMRSKLNKAGFNYCKNLILMPLAGEGDYPNLLREILHRFADEEAEIVTHPGLKTEKQYDYYSDGRIVEYDSLLLSKNN